MKYSQEVVNAANSSADAYVELLELLKYDGKERETRCGKAITAFNQHITFKNVPIICDEHMHSYADVKQCVGEALAIKDKAATNKELLNKYGCYFWDKILKNAPYAAIQYDLDLDRIDWYSLYANNSRQEVLTLNPSCCYNSIILNHIDRQLVITVNYRSCDLGIGLLSDIIVFWALFENRAYQGNNGGIHSITLNIANAHIYSNHLSQVFEREYRSFCIPMAEAKLMDYYQIKRSEKPLLKLNIG